MDKDAIRKLASREGIDHQSKPVPMASRIKLDLVVIGSVAVDKLGHRIGKGEGFADLEFAMAASHHGAVTNETLVVTTVHDVQVFDEIPESLFEAHDLSVDIIVTPTEVFRVEKPLPKPDHIIWNLLTKEKFDQVPILKEIQFKEKKAGKNTLLKNETVEENGKSEAENNKKNNANKKSNRDKKANNPKPNKKKVSPATENGSADKNGVEPKSTTNGKDKEPNESGKNVKKESSPSKKSSSVKKSKPNFTTVGVFIGKIPRGTRVKELKELITERGIRPVNVLWKGAKGYAMIYFEKKDDVTSEDLCAKLKDLKVGDNVLNVEPDKRANSKNKSDEKTAKKNGVVENEKNNDDAATATTQNEPPQIIEN